MIQSILTDGVVGISKLKSNPQQVMADANGQPVAVLSRNKPVFYAVPAAYYERLMERLEDADLMQIVRDRQNESTVKVKLDEL